MDNFLNRKLISPKLINQSMPPISYYYLHLKELYSSVYYLKDTQVYGGLAIEPVILSHLHRNKQGRYD